MCPEENNHQYEWAQKVSTKSFSFSWIFQVVLNNPVSNSPSCLLLRSSFPLAFLSISSSWGLSYNLCPCSNLAYCPWYLQQRHHSRISLIYLGICFALLQRQISCSLYSMSSSFLILTLMCAGVYHIPKQLPKKDAWGNILKSQMFDLWSHGWMTVWLDTEFLQNFEVISPSPSSFHCCFGGVWSQSDS